MIIAEQQKQYLLLQINDALFPIGNYAHSYGVETYIHKDIIVDKESAFHFISNYLKYSMCYTDLLGMKLAYEYGRMNSLGELLLLEDKISAGKIPREIREAGHKLGSRFCKTIEKLEIEYSTGILQELQDILGKGSLSHCLIYGVFCAACNIEKQDAMANYLYGQTSALITNCVKAVPLSQTAGQQMLTACYPIFQDILDNANKADENMLGISLPGYDIRCMQHEGLYSRIYMS